MVKQNSEDICEIVEDPNGKLELFGYKYSKNPINSSIKWHLKNGETFTIFGDFLTQLSITNAYKRFY